MLLKYALFLALFHIALEYMHCSCIDSEVEEKLVFCFTQN